jgi:hypothetical protein
VTPTRLLPSLLLALLAAFTGSPSAAASSIIVQPAPYCQPGQAPRFALGFDDLAGRLGEPMGQPVECEHVDPVSGDIQQQTTTGLAYYQAASNTSSFTNGWRHWSLIDGRLVTWSGPDAGPHPAACRERDDG